MSRRLTAYLAAGALFVSVGVGSIGAYQGLAADIPDDPDTRPPGLTSSQIGGPPPRNPFPIGQAKKADFIPAATPEDPPPDGEPIGQAKKADFIPAATSDESLAGSSRKASRTEVSV
jgi:hypothetical protein